MEIFNSGNGLELFTLFLQLVEKDYLEKKTTEGQQKSIFRSVVWNKGFLARLL